MYFKWATGTCLSIPENGNIRTGPSPPILSNKTWQNTFFPGQICVYLAWTLVHVGLWRDIWIWHMDLVPPVHPVINPLKLGCFVAVDFGGVYPWANANHGGLVGFASPIPRCRIWYYHMNLRAPCECHLAGKEGLINKGLPKEQWWWLINKPFPNPGGVGIAGVPKKILMNICHMCGIWQVDRVQYLNIYSWFVCTKQVPIGKGGFECIFHVSLPEQKHVDISDWWWMGEPESSLAFNNADWVYQD